MPNQSDTGPYSGLYDPVKAEIFSINRSLSPEREPVEDSPTSIGKRYIRFMRSANTELAMTLQNITNNIAIIRMRRDSVTESLKTSDYIIHRGNKYGIVGPNQITYRADEVEYNCSRGITE